MKIRSILMAVLALAVMSACQKEAPQSSVKDPSSANSVGYVALKINLPSTMGTKAGESFEDGEAYEYKVNDVNVIFYNDAGDYIYHTSVSPNPWDNNAAGDITVSGKTGAIKITAEGATQALVLINSDGVVSASDLVKSYGDLNVAISGNAQKVTGASNDDFFMSNAPKYVGDKFTALVPVTLSETALEAEAAPATVQVERAAAKVQLNYAAEFTNSNGKAKITGWNLSVTNKSFYPVRKGLDKAASNGWFDASSDPVNAGLLGTTRVYWAEDPNYTGTYGTFDATQFDKVEASALTLANGGVAYCLENTFETGSMRENQTTTAMIKAVYTPDTFTEGETWFMVGTGNTIYSLDAFATYVVGKLPVGTSVTADQVKALAFTAGDCSSLTVDGKSLSSLVGTVTCYLDGVCYYPVKIRHFNYEELGYADEDAFKSAFKLNSGYSAQDLGRYGVLRNTWYKVTVNSITNPGTPEVPAPGIGSDDEYEQFCACTIDILAWSVRNHSVNL